jgi:hypothetical protein
MSVNTFTFNNDDVGYHSDIESVRSNEGVTLASEIQLARDLMAEADRIMRAGSRLMEYAMNVEARASRSFRDKAKKRANLH